MLYAVLGLCEYQSIWQFCLPISKLCIRLTVTCFATTKCFDESFIRLESVQPRTSHRRETARCRVRVVVPSEHHPRVQSSYRSAIFIGGFFLRILTPTPPYCCGVPRNSDHCHRVWQHVSMVAPHRCHSRVRGRRRCQCGNVLEESTHATMDSERASDIVPARISRVPFAQA